MHDAGAGSTPHRPAFQNRTVSQLESRGKQRVMTRRLAEVLAAGMGPRVVVTPAQQCGHTGPPHE